MVRQSDLFVVVEIGNNVVVGYSLRVHKKDKFTEIELLAVKDGSEA